jgi:hypothetical protein
MSPREHLQHEWDLDFFQKQSAHARELKRLEIELRRSELKLRQEDAVKARKHYEQMKELEYAIRFQETRWRSLVRIPLMIIKLPVLIIIAVGATIEMIRTKEIPKDIIELLK